MLGPPAVVEIGGVVAGALSGALHGVRAKGDAIGVFVLSLATGVGGGIVGDVLIGRGPPAALRSSWYLLAVGGAALVALLLTSLLARADRLLEWVDAVLLGLWAVMGMEKAAVAGLPVVSAIFLGVVTATGGTVLRDLLSGQRPAIMRRGELYVSAAAVAAIVNAALVSGLRLPAAIGQIAAIAVATALRLLAMRFHWMAPGPFDLGAWWRQRQQRRNGSL